MIHGRCSTASSTWGRSLWGRAQGKAAKRDANATSGPAATKTDSATAPIWADRPLPFAALARLDADLDLAAEALIWQRITTRGLQARAKLRSGRLQLDGVRLALPGLILVVVDGTLKAPRVTIDPGDLFVEGAAAWATGGLSLVADQITRRLTAFRSPCETVLKQDAPDTGPKLE